MGKRDCIYQLSDEVKLDEAFPSRMAYDDEVEEHHGKAGLHIPIVG